MFIKRTDYADAYARLKQDSLSTSCAVLLFVALDADALCACKMLTSLLKSDFIPHKIHPIAGYADLEAANRALVEGNDELRYLILVNCGALIDLSRYLTIQEELKVYVLDSHRPWNLANAFADATNVMVFDDGDIELDLAEVGRAFRGLLEPESHGESEENEDSGSEQSEEGSGSERGADEEAEEESERPSQRRKLSPENSGPKGKREKRSNFQLEIAKYYDRGTWYGDSVASLVYGLASELGREDNDLLWHAIVGVTSLESHNRSPPQRYKQMYQLLKDEVNRLNAPPIETLANEELARSRSNGKHSSDYSIRAESEYRFMLVRHWSLYDAMLHSPYLGARLNIWSESGRRKLNKMLAKMGFSLLQCRQIYTHMDMDLKRALRDKLEHYAPLYGCDDIIYPSFVRTFGFKCTLSASDAAYAITALIEGGTRVALSDENKENQPKEATDAAGAQRTQEWVDNFWKAFDALGNIDALRVGLTAAMNLQRAIVRTGTALIDKRSIRHLRSFRMACLKEGPDLATFTHPLALTKLALWISEAINYQVTESSKRQLPFVIAALNEKTDLYMIVGTSTTPTTALDNEQSDQGHGRNRFGIAFQEIAQAQHARVRIDSFEASVVECRREDLMCFFEGLSLRAIL